MRIRRSTVRFMAACVISIIASAGCETTTVGGIPGPKTDVERVKAQLDLARGYLETRDLNRARRPIERALEIDSRSTEAHVLMAVLLTAEGDTGLAETYYRQALKIEPDNAQALNNFGKFLYDQSRYVESLVPLRKVVGDTGYTRRAQAYENLGFAELRAGEEKNAELAFERALMLNVAQPRSNLELAHIYFDRERYTLAREYYTEYVKLVRQQNARSLWLGVRLSRIFDDVDALASYSLALKHLFPDSTEYQLLAESEK